MQRKLNRFLFKSTFQQKVRWKQPELKLGNKQQKGEQETLIKLRKECLQAILSNFLKGFYLFRILKKLFCCPDPPVYGA